MEVWRALAQLAAPYRRQFAFVALLALFATTTDLVGPLIYRAAVNDIAGLFVGAPGTRPASCGMGAVSRRPREALFVLGHHPQGILVSPHCSRATFANNAG